ncbi:hypothetical protein [Burkholderia territorii]|uniref:hypothetical protein n=1 Tax=Burkholderia territorii TaxID=1503055 RepID=UPI000AA6823D|nr:hypothetical protein [Burkholderia territorii]
MALVTLTEAEERELSRLSRFYWREALRCEESKAYLAGSVMLGSALEALLMLMVNVYENEVAATRAFPTRDSTPLPLLDWNLSQLLRVAKAAGWLPYALKMDGDWSGRKAKVGDYAEVSRMIRNLLHPGRYIKDHSPGRVTARYLARQFEIVLLCRDWLAYQNDKSLKEHLREEGIL